MRKQVQYLVLLSCILCSCSVQKYLPAGERLYRGATVKMDYSTDSGAVPRRLKKQLNLAAKPTPNRFALGMPYKVWWWYVLGEPKKSKGLKFALRNKLGEPPILSSKVNTTITARNMQAFLQNLGYFNAGVTGDTLNEGYMTKARYVVQPRQQYRIKNITWIHDSSNLVQLLAEKQLGGILKPGNAYRLSDIQAERDRLDLFIKSKGYYYFSPDYIMAYADSTIGNHEVNLLLGLRQTMPAVARHPYTINKITLFPNYTLLLPPPDTSKRFLTNVDGLWIRDTVHRFRSFLFEDLVTYRAGALYNSREQNTTLNRLINVGTFKFVKNRFEPVRDPSDPYKLNVYYYLTPAKKKSVQAALQGYSKEHRFLGTQLSVSWRNRNTFKAAELISFKVYGAFELSFADTLRNSNNFRLGAEAAISLPRFYIPFVKIREKGLYPPHTRLMLGYEIYRKQYFYSKNIYRLQYEFNWKQGSNKEHILAPVSVTYIRPAAVTDTFTKQTAINPALAANLYKEILLGSFYSYTYNTANPFARRQFFFNGSVDFAGNIAGAISGPATPRQKQVFNTPFAQYAKADIDLRYQVKLSNRVPWVSRLQIGVGLPYNNSNMLPFSKQYIIGGASSLRGFRMRQMGPGSYKPTRFDQAYFILIGGDYKLLFNTELRIPLFAKFTGALFLDAGNIWTKDTLLYGEAGQLKKDFYKEIAIASGAGIRFDAGLVLLRLDVGVALRKPFLPEDQRWIFNQIRLGSKAWRQQNMIFNVALGFPF